MIAGLSAFGVFCVSCCCFVIVRGYCYYKDCLWLLVVFVVVLSL